MRKDWTSEEVARLHKMREAGMTTPEIGRVLGRSKSAVISRLNRKGATPRGDKADPSLVRARRDRAMCADYIGGMTQAQLAKKYGLSQNYVAKCLGLRGMTLPKSSRGRRIAEGLARSPFRSGPAGIPAHLRSDYRNIRRTGFTPPEAKKMLGLEA